MFYAMEVESFTSLHANRHGLLRSTELRVALE